MEETRKTHRNVHGLTRREVVQRLGIAVATSPFMQLLGCSSDDENSNAQANAANPAGAGGATGPAGSPGSTVTAGTASGSSGVGASAGSGAQAGTDANAGANAGANANARAAANAGSSAEAGSGGEPGAGAGAGGGAPGPEPVDGWANGGTDLLQNDFPDPFASGLGSSCELVCSATLGPCYAATLMRKDVSEGKPGLPTRLAFLLVDESCQPIEGASIDIWHSAPQGVYSGDDSIALCTLNDSEALMARWFRGVQVTDANGRADFDTCFPGWYTGRAIHIHATVTVNGTEYVTTQFYFQSELIDDVLTNHPLYNNRGAPDTTNATDFLAPAALDQYTFQTERMANGVLLASKAIVIRSSPATALCAT